MALRREMAERRATSAKGATRAFPASLARPAWRKDRRLQQKRSSIMWLGLIHDKPVREGLVRVETI